MTYPQLSSTYDTDTYYTMGTGALSVLSPPKYKMEFPGVVIDLIGGTATYSQDAFGKKSFKFDSTYMLECNGLMLYMDPRITIEYSEMHACTTYVYTQRVGNTKLYVSANVTDETMIGSGDPQSTLLYTLKHMEYQMVKTLKIEKEKLKKVTMDMKQLEAEIKQLDKAIQECEAAFAEMLGKVEVAADAFGGFSATVTAPNPKPWKPKKSGKSWNAATSDLFRHIKGLNSSVDTLCPGDNSAGKICGAKQGVWTQIIHLNDIHHWTREQIADWLDKLHADGILDLSVSPVAIEPNEVASEPTADQMLEIANAPLYIYDGKTETWKKVDGTAAGEIIFAGDMYPTSSAVKPGDTFLEW